MKRIFTAFFLLFVTALCFSQQLPKKIIGGIPSAGSSALYQIQVGAYKNSKNAESAFLRLKKPGFNPVYEKYQDYTRVLVSGVPAILIRGHLAQIKQLGFDEVIIREVKTPFAINEKWEITSQDGNYASFEFNLDNNFIAATKDNNSVFGSYSMPEKNTINMDKLGVIKVTEDKDVDVSLLFYPADEPDTPLNFTAVRAERMPESPETDLFCRTWKVVSCTKPEYVGDYLFISSAGTYFFTEPDGVTNSMSQWRWHNDRYNDFDYSHNKWRNYGRAEILELSEKVLKIFDPGFNGIIPGYSKADLENYYELAPVNR